jgi:hypothetical protein
MTDKGNFAILPRPSRAHRADPKGERSRGRPSYSSSPSRPPLSDRVRPRDLHVPFRPAGLWTGIASRGQIFATSGRKYRPNDFLGASRARGRQGESKRRRAVIRRQGHRVAREQCEMKFFKGLDFGLGSNCFMQGDMNSIRESPESVGIRITGQMEERDRGCYPLSLKKGKQGNFVRSLAIP